jgi:hypothetical protein
MKRFYALLIVALFATAPALMAQSASFYNATRDAEKMIKKMPTENYRRAYVGFNDAHINWKDYDHECEMWYPVKSGFTLGYLQSYHILKGLPVFVEYGANIQYLFGKEELSKNFADWLHADSYKANTFALNVPVNVSMRLSFENNTIAVTPYAGLNFRLNLMGKQVVSAEDIEAEVKIFDKSDDEGAAGEAAFNRLQLGFNFGVAVSYDVYTLSIGRVSDFSRISKDGKGRLGVTTISVGYAF